MTKKTNKKKLAVGASALALSLFAVPYVVQNTAYADSETDTKGSQVKVSINSAIAMTIEGNCDSLVADDDTLDSCSQIITYPNSFGQAATDVTVYTNNEGGFKLTVRANGNSSLKNDDDVTIPAGILNGETGGQGLWSFKTDGVVTDWSKMPTSDVMIKSVTNTTPTGDKTTVTYGVSTQKAQAQGTYVTTLTYTATAYDDDTKPDTITVPKFWQISNMQEMTKEVCDSVYTPGNMTTKDNAEAVDKLSAKNGGYEGVSGEGTKFIPETTLTDTRDGSLYTVRKLADGNCWMTENLRLEIKTDTVLSSADSDIAATRTNSGPAGYWIPASDTGVYTYYNGDAHEYEPAHDLTASGLAEACLTTIKTGGGFVTENASCHSKWDPDNVNNASVVDMIRSYTNGTEKISTLDGDSQYYGVYYNWYTATAGSGTYSMTSASGDADSSVCPAGFQLPRNEGDKSWYNLLFTKYGLQNDAASSQTMRKFPLSVVLSGWYYSVNGDREWITLWGFSWSASARDSMLAYHLRIEKETATRPESLKPQTYERKTYGYPVRCVSKD